MIKLNEKEEKYYQKLLDVTNDVNIDFLDVLNPIIISYAHKSKDIFKEGIDLTNILFYYIDNNNKNLNRIFNHNGLISALEVLSLENLKTYFKKLNSDCQIKLLSMIEFGENMCVLLDIDKTIKNYKDFYIPRNIESRYGIYRIITHNFDKFSKEDIINVYKNNLSILIEKTPLKMFLLSLNRVYSYETIDVVFEVMKIKFNMVNKDNNIDEMKSFYSTLKDFEFDKTLIFNTKLNDKEKNDKIYNNIKNMFLTSLSKKNYVKIFL